MDGRLVGSLNNLAPRTVPDAQLISNAYLLDEEQARQIRECIQ